MELSGEQLLPVDQQRAWAALNDVDVLQACVPGCESMKRTAQDRYEATVNAAIGPVRARFTGTFSLADVNAPESYTLRFDGSGGATGFVRGQARVVLRADGPDRTILSYATSAQVGGKLAQIGSRLIDAAAGAMSEKFFASFSQRLAAAPAGAAAAGAQEAPRGPGLWSLLWAILRRLFARR
ncbi:MAG TPA: carbon monoxide dehydrogenase subunit G [Burkholderiaceae bacterium]|nr:carbon monoxide dehydrogenase subunit G [Burkholderiaceae bacterium]